MVSPDALLVLVVDDDSMVRGAIEKYLVRVGLRTITASGHKQALELLRDHPIDAIIADFGLGSQQTGLDVLNDSIGVRPTAMRILITGELGLGVDDHPAIDVFLAKPISGQTLTAAFSARWPAFPNRQ